jgi:hypothetical protein
MASRLRFSILTNKLAEPESDRRASLPNEHS